MKIVKPEDFNFYNFAHIPEQKRNPGNPGSRSKRRYKDIITAFDIETTNLEDIEQAVMYIWQWAIGPDIVVVGRTWEQFTEFTRHLALVMKPHEKLAVYVHNLSFEFSFLKGIYHFEPEEVFCMDSRKILKCSMYDGKIEFRCSYLQTNMSLDEFTNKMGAEHSKLVHRFHVKHRKPGKLTGKIKGRYNINHRGSFGYNYKKKRYPWTKMTDNELVYCINDVVGLVEAMTIEMQHDGDTLYSVAATSTGYVRRDCKRAMQKIRHDWAKNLCPSYHLFEMLREAFRGGNTHGSRFFAGQIIDGPIHQVDRSSSYPDVIVNHKFPGSCFYEIGPCSLKKFYELYRDMHRAIVFRVEFRGIRLNAGRSACPYLSKDKSWELYEGVFDNGRVLAASRLCCTLTDVDFRIVESMYQWRSMKILDLAYTRYRKLPQPFVDVVNEYYRRKTALKNVESEELNYFRAKQKLNSLYGMMATLPVRPVLQYVDDEYIYKDDDPEKLLKQDNARRILPPYQFGCWVTAWARYELQLCLDRVEQTPGAYFLYTDTDSIKYIGDVDFSDYNAEKIRDSKKNGGYAVDPKGITHYMGVFEEEATAKRFVTQGAKKYAYEDLDGKLHITVAGVIKKKGAEELARKGGLEAFKPDFIFTESGGIEAVYNDDPKVKEIEIEGHKLSITSNVMLRDSTYTLGITDEYEQLLSLCQGLTLDLF